MNPKGKQNTPNEYELQFLRVSVHSPKLEVAETDYNVERIIAHLETSKEEQCDIALFPELSICGYSCADLFYQTNLLQECEAGLERIAKKSLEKQISCVVGLPVRKGGRLYNGAAFVSGGDILGVIPKIHLPNTNEYYEERWFSSGKSQFNETIFLAGREIPFGRDLLFKPTNFSSCVFGIELCEDLWAPNPPSGDMALAGANVILNLSASNEILGKKEYRRDLVKQQSARCLAAYLYACAGPNESTTDIVFSGHCLIAENGRLLSESERLQFEGSHIVSDIDLEQLGHDRLKNSCFSNFSANIKYRIIDFELFPQSEKRFQDELRRSIPKTPFVPQNKDKRSENCREIFSIQTAGLIKRLKTVNSKKNVIGLSGGLDSTLAFLVMVKAYQTLGWPLHEITALTMPGMGTTERTKNNAQKLCQLLNATLRVIDIKDAARQHFKDIGHDESQHDVTFENAQARERTQILMDIANQVGGIVVGTGDLSEMALGWCTYNGDHMSMYHVNSGVPKTLVRYLVEWVAEVEHTGETRKVLEDISATPITPELLPADGEEITQKTEEVIGPYELHDFFLYHMVRYGFLPKKILFLAEKAFQGVYTRSEIKKWLALFYRRFFHNQFKRSATPDTVKVGSVALSPRGDWRMPSDAKPEIWLKAIDSL